MRYDVTIHVFMVKLILNIVTLKPEILHCSNNMWEFPGGLVVRILGFHCLGPGFIPGQGNEILQAMWHNQKKKKKNKSEVIDCFKKFLIKKTSGM